MTAPYWALRLVGAVLAYEDIHSKDADPCFREAISLVPDEEIAAARVLNDYAPVDEVTALRLTALRQLGEQIRDTPMPGHGHDILVILDATAEDLKEYLR